MRRGANSMIIRRTSISATKPSFSLTLLWPIRGFRSIAWYAIGYPRSSIIIVLVMLVVGIEPGNELARRNAHARLERGPVAAVEGMLDNRDLCKCGSDISCVVQGSVINDDDLSAWHRSAEILQGCSDTLPLIKGW